MKLNIRLGKLLALVPEYNAKLRGWRDAAASTYVDRIAGIYQAQPCVDWDGAILEIVITVREQELMGVVLDGGSGVNIFYESTLR